MNSKDKGVDNLTIGIFGCGHLGTALASSLLRNKHPTNQLLVSSSGESTTKERLKKYNLEKLMVKNEYLTKHSDIIFYTVRPSDYNVIKGYEIKGGAFLVSMLAGTPINRIYSQLDGNIKKIRVMTSAPDTIQRGMGLAACFGDTTYIISDLLSRLGFKTVALNREDAFDPFTAFGPCLPIVLGYCKAFSIPVDLKKIRTEAELSQLGSWMEIIDWADLVKPKMSKECADKYLDTVCTPGGVTEAVVKSLRTKQNPLEAINAGVSRSIELNKR